MVSGKTTDKSVGNSFFFMSVFVVLILFLALCYIYYPFVSDKIDSLSNDGFVLENLIYNLKNENYSSALNLFPKINPKMYTKEPNLLFYWGYAYLKINKESKGIEKWLEFYEMVKSKYPRSKPEDLAENFNLVDETLIEWMLK